MDINEFYQWNKKTILIVGANVLGLLLILGVVKLLYRVAEGPMPDPVIASTREVAEYWASPAMKNKSDSAKLQFFQNTLQSITESPTRMEEFAQQINDLPEEQIEQLKENVFDAAKIQVVEDAREYAQLRTSSERKTFLDSKISRFSNVRTMITGHHSSSAPPAGGQIASGSRNSGRSQPNLAANPKVTKDVPTDPGTMYKMVIDRSNPGDRAKMETYVKDVNDRVTQLKAINKARIMSN